MSLDDPKKSARSILSALDSRDAHNDRSLGFHRNQINAIKREQRESAKLRGLLGRVNEDGSIDPPRSIRVTHGINERPNVREALAMFYRNRGNRPVHPNTLATATGHKRSSIRACLSKDAGFVRAPGLPGYWRMAESDDFQHARV